MLYIIFLFSYEGISYDIKIDSMIFSVDSAELVKWNREISGEDKIFHYDDSVYILTRYYDSYGMKIAEDYLYGYIESLGLETYKQVFFLTGGFEKKANYDTYKWSGKYSDFHVVNDTLIYMISTDGLLYYTVSSGYRWILLYDFANEVDGLESHSADTLYVFSRTGEIYFSEDGGNNFESRVSLIPTGLEDMQFINSKRGWILNNGGTVARTVNAGKTWDILEMNIPITKDIFFIDSLNGWLCGYFGRIYHSEDGGEDWVEQNTPGAYNLYGLYFINPDTGWTCGDDGTLLRTTDGGDSWDDISFGNKDFRIVYFENSLEGFIGGTNGNLYHTSNGGINWDTVPISTSTFNGIFNTDNNLFLCCDRDFILKEDTTYFKRLSYLPNAVCNIIAIQPGIIHPDTAIIIGAHADSWSNPFMNYIRAPGANDNGTGVNTVREAARILSNYDFDYTIEYILYGAEEIGLVGSEYYADNARTENKPIKGVINLDCLGYDNIGTHNIDVISDTGGSDFALMALDVISLYSIPLSVVYFDTTASYLGTDISSFWEVGYRGVNFWNSKFGPINSIHDSIHVINPSMHFNMTKLVVGELAYMADYSYLSVPEDLIAPVAIEIENQIVKGSSFTFKVTGSNNLMVKINLYDVTGRLVHNVFKGLIRNGKIFNISKELNAGVYFLKLECGIRSVSKKLLIFN